MSSIKASSQECSAAHHFDFNIIHLLSKESTTFHILNHWKRKSQLASLFIKFDFDLSIYASIIFAYLKPPVELLKFTTVYGEIWVNKASFRNKKAEDIRRLLYFFYQTGCLLRINSLFDFALNTSKETYKGGTYVASKKELIAFNQGKPVGDKEYVEYLFGKSLAEKKTLTEEYRVESMHFGNEGKIEVGLTSGFLVLPEYLLITPILVKKKKEKPKIEDYCSSPIDPNAVYDEQEEDEDMSDVVE